MSVHYPWPASALTQADMSLLHEVRQEGKKRVPITKLVARAVRTTYAGHNVLRKGGK